MRFSTMNSALAQTARRSSREMMRLKGVARQALTNLVRVRSRDKPTGLTRASDVQALSAGASSVDDDAPAVQATSLRR